eukprot:jgi/Hompol1/1322/HPOL_005558-RA
MVVIGESERNYITAGVESGIRADGRGPEDSRQLFLETGVITQASGSCRVTIDWGTDVLVGVKAQVGDIESGAETATVDDLERTGNASAANTDEAAQVSIDAASGTLGMPGLDGSNDTQRQNAGRIVFSVECSPSAKSTLSSKEIDDMCNEYSQILNRTLNGPHGGIDLGSLCIIPGSTCWVISVDVLILDYGGNVMDTIFMAVRGALHNTRLPKVTVEQTDGHFEFDIADEETEPLKGRENVPVALTLSKIGSGCIVDATPIEDLCSNARVTVFANRSNNVCGLQKSGKGSLDPSILADMIEVGTANTHWLVH